MALTGTAGNRGSARDCSIVGRHKEGTTHYGYQWAARYERGSIILTSNKGFAEWGEVLGDTVIATAILDRLLHHSHVLNIRGESYRLREKKRAGLFGPAQTRPEVTHSDQTLT